MHLSKTERNKNLPEYFTFNQKQSTLQLCVYARVLFRTEVKTMTRIIARARTSAILLAYY